MKTAFPLLYKLLIAVSWLLTATFQTGNSFAADPILPDIPFDYSVVLPSHLQAVRAPFSELPNISNVATLGRVLFYDKSLSKNGLVSCASCHKQANGFDDPIKRSIGFKGKVTERSSMGLVNARFNANGRYFWDERASSLPAQVLQPFFDPVEMGQKAGGLVSAVEGNEYYNALFGKAYGEAGVNKDKIAFALAAFINAIVSTNSRYDKARQLAVNHLQDFPEFSALENLGKFIFFNPPQMGGAGCSACHQGEAMISLAGGANNGLDNDTSLDAGVGRTTKIDTDEGKFRPPSLRNISLRTPYMHDGRFKNLEQVIEHYSTGIRNHRNLGESLKDARGKAKRFKFTPNEKAALLAFLETLSDRQLLTDPKFSNPFH